MAGAKNDLSSYFRQIFAEPAGAFLIFSLLLLALVGIASQTAIRATSMTTLALMVRHGLGPTVLPILALRHEVGGADDLVLRAFAEGTSGGPPPLRGVALVWRRTSPRGGGYRALADVIRGSLDLLDAGVPRDRIRGGAPRLLERSA